MDSKTNQGFGRLDSGPLARSIGTRQLLATALACLCLLSCSASFAADPSRKIRHVLFYDGQVREFTVYLPPAHNNQPPHEQASPLPVVFAFHGVMMNGETMGERDQREAEQRARDAEQRARDAEREAERKAREAERKAAQEELEAKEEAYRRFVAANGVTSSAPPAHDDDAIREERRAAMRRLKEFRDAQSD